MAVLQVALERGGLMARLRGGVTPGAVQSLIGGPLGQRRVSLGLSQRDVAERAGVTRETIAGVETGYSLPNIHTAFRHARALGLTLDDYYELLLETGYNGRPRNRARRRLKDARLKGETDEQG